MPAAPKPKIKLKLKGNRILEDFGPPDFRTWIHKQPCCVCGARGIPSNPIEAAHVEARGMGGRKTKDFWKRNILPMCRVCHQLSSTAVGWGPVKFAAQTGWDKDLMRHEAQRVYEKWLTSRQ